MSRDPIVRYLAADVCCYHCGHVSGILRRPHGVPGAPTFFVDHARVVRSAVKRLTELRCARCHGPLYALPFELRHELAPVDMLDGDEERPRRGRPPRRLSEQRPAELRAG